MLVTLRVWLNRTFATNHHVVHMLKNNPDQEPVHVLASHADPDSPVLAAADERFTDPTHLDAEQYVEFALGFCRDHDVSVFWPTWHQEALAHARGRFEALGVHLMTSPPHTIGLFEDKARTYEHAARLGLPVPDYRVVTTVEEFTDAYTTIKDLGHAQVCMKPIVGVGAEGFRIISNGPRTFESLTAKAGDHISYTETVALLGQRSVFSPYLVMPFLAGGEVSVDALAYEGKVLSAVPRFKRPSTRAVELLDSPELVNWTATLVAEYDLAYLVNAQFRFDDAGKPYLLEVNTRASGGLFQSCLSGGNLPWAAVQVARHGIGARVPTPRFPVRLSTLSSAVELPA